MSKSKVLISYGKLSEKQIRIFDEMSDKDYNIISMMILDKLRLGKFDDIKEISFNYRQYIGIVTFDSKNKDLYCFDLNFINN